jgi:hypothetical protein
MILRQQRQREFKTHAAVLVHQFTTPFIGGWPGVAVRIYGFRKMPALPSG